MTSNKECDPKLAASLEFIFERIGKHVDKHAGRLPPPFFLGISSIQGAGKTTLADSIAKVLRGHPYWMPTVVASIDDFYLTHADQQRLAESHGDNPLLQHRGEPGTHDVKLAMETFTSLRDGRPVKVPKYDKSAHNGRGDRMKYRDWQGTNGLGEPRAAVVIFEGWCVGFKGREWSDVADHWVRARREKDKDPRAYTGQLANNALINYRFINDALFEYEKVFSFLDALIHLETETYEIVYKWRMEQESALRASKGSGMTPEEVQKFVDGYFPAYELYGTDLRNGFFVGSEKRQLRLLLGKNRELLKSERI